MPTSRKETRAPAVARSEPDLWKLLEKAVSDAVRFWNNLLDLRDDASRKLDAKQLERFVMLVRAVSWVESRHGTGSGNHPDRDPMQCGNPGDAWWPQIAGLSGNGERFVGGPNAENYWAKELPDVVAAAKDFPASAKVSVLAKKEQGHRDAGFNPTLSIYWAVPHLIWKTNVSAGRNAYQCASVGRQELLDGATEYNAGGDPNYRQKIDDALTSIGWPAAIKLEAAAFDDVLQTEGRDRGSPAVVSEAIRLLTHIAAFADEDAAAPPVLFPKGIHSIRLKIEVTGAGSVELDINGPNAEGLYPQFRTRAALVALPCQPTSPTAARIAKTCDDSYDSNNDDCNKFVKAVSNPYFGDLFDGQNADGIIATLSSENSGWTKTGSITQAIANATQGLFVVGGMTSGDLGDTHGHLAVVVGCPGQMSGNVIVPLGYAGSLKEAARIRGARLSGSFPAKDVRDEKVSYFSRSVTN